MPQVGETAPVDPHPRVDLLAVVAPRVAEGELSVGPDVRGAVRNHALAHGHVAVLDHHLRRAPSPLGVPGAHPLAGERALDTRLRESEEHHAVELSRAADVHGASRRAERRHDAGEHAIAFEPVQARHVKRDAGLLAVGRPPLELDVGLRRGGPALAEHNPVRIERVDDVPGERQVSERRVSIERARLRRKRRLLRELFRPQLARHRRRPRRRGGCDFALAALLGPLPELPVEVIAPRRAAAEPQALRFEEVRQLREVDVGVGDLPRRADGHVPLVERRQPVVELGGASVEPARRVRHLHPIRHPQHRTAQVGKPPGVHAQERTAERALQLASSLEQVERAVEVSLARELEVVAMEEDVLLRRKIDLR